MIYLVLLVFLFSPIIALVAIISAVANSNERKRLEVENVKLSMELASYKLKFGKIDVNSVSESSKVANLSIDNIEKQIDREVAKKEEVSKVVKEQIEVKEEKKSFSDSFKEYVDTNNISQGNLLFALGVIFISVAGIVFATTTWRIIPNVFKLIIILLVALIVLFISYFAKSKFKLVKTSIALYILFCILTSLIPLSMGYFHMIGEYLVIGGKGEFLLYATSLLIFIVLFAIGTKYYKLNKIAPYIPYIINIDILLVILNFTKKIDMIVLILSIYNLILQIFTKKIKSIDTLKIYTKNLEKVVNNSLLAIAVISLLNISSGPLMTMISLAFSVMFILDKITLRKENDLYKYLIASVFLIASCLRFSASYSFNYMTEYFVLLIVILTIVISTFKKFNEDKFVYMIYILLIVMIFTMYRDFMMSDVTLRLLMSMIVNLFAMAILTIKSNDKLSKYLKTMYYMLFVLSISKYIYSNYKLDNFYIMSIAHILILFGYIVSNFLNEKLFKNKFADKITNAAYSILISLITVGLALIYPYSSDNKIIILLVHNILLILTVLIIHINKIKYKKDSLFQNIEIVAYVALFALNCLLITKNSYANAILLIYITLEYIKKDNLYIRYAFPLSYLIYFNLLAYYVIGKYNIIFLDIMLVLYFVIFNLIGIKKIRKIDFNFIDATAVVNLGLLYYNEYILNKNILSSIVTVVLFDILLLYIYYVRKNKIGFVIEIMIQISMFVTASLIHWQVTGMTRFYGFIDLFGYPRYENFLRAYYIALIVVAILRLFVDKIRNITRFSMPFALFLCSVGIIRHLSFRNNKNIFDFIGSFYKLDGYLLTAILAIYLIAILFYLKNKNRKYESRFIGALIIANIITIELLFIHLINDLYINKFKQMIYFGRYSEVLFYFVLINFFLFIIYKYALSIYLKVKNNKVINNIYDFNSLAYRIKNVYMTVINVIVFVGTIVLLIVYGIIYNFKLANTLNYTLLLLRYIISAIIYKHLFLYCNYVIKFNIIFGR